MKEIRPASRAKEWFACLCLLLAFISAGFAQTSSIPTVIVGATQPIATTSNSGAFAVFRLGDTNAALNVWYDLGGTASNGVDYAAIPPHLVQLPAGAVSNVIVITPSTNLPASAVETVVLTLTNSPMMTPVNYQIGSPSSATVYLEGSGVTNLPPRVNIYRPTNGAAFFTPVNVPIFATASASSGIASVEFFANGQDLGSGALAGCVTPIVTCVGCPSPLPICFYYLYWSNAPVGNYSLTAVVTDGGGLLTTSAPVNISVQLPTNPPVVNIINPTNGATFAAPAGIPLIAKASDLDVDFTNVEFFANGADVGRGVSIALDPPGVNGVTGLVYFFNWQNVPTNTYTLTAVAVDNAGAAATSAPVNITVQLPGTNLPPVVRMISPPNGAVFRAPMQIPVFAYAVDPDDAVASVQFFAGGASIGFGHPVTIVPMPTPPGPAQPPIQIVAPTNFWELTWTNPPVGLDIPLTAIASGNSSLSTTSNPVFVSILPPLPPPTNRPALVRIVATDPVAIEGTNCWTWPGLVGPTATWSNWYAPTATFRLFTNCGPKNATFSVFRLGYTNNDLTVAYAIGGTASNGVDYVPLPGTVTIPAGARRADITVVPIDDGPPDITSTVVLKLAPDVTGTNYLLGYPRSAAAIILDSQSPRAATGLVPGSAFNLAAAGPDGAWFHVEYSTDLVNWTPICTNQVVNGSIDFVDPDAAANPLRYYRTVPEAGPPE